MLVESLLGSKPGGPMPHAWQALQSQSCAELIDLGFGALEDPQAVVVRQARLDNLVDDVREGH